MSYTLTLDVPDEVYTSLLKTAAQTGQQPEALAVQWIAQATRQDADDPVEAFIGVLDTHGSDWVEHHDAYLGGTTPETQPPLEKKESL